MTFRSDWFFPPLFLFLPLPLPLLLLLFLLPVSASLLSSIAMDGWRSFVSIKNQFKSNWPLLSHFSAAPLELRRWNASLPPTSASVASPRRPLHPPSLPPSLSPSPFLLSFFLSSNALHWATNNALVTQPFDKKPTGLLTLSILLHRITSAAIENIKKRKKRKKKKNK